MAKEKILMSGNEAIAEGALAAGCSFYAGYPITPQNELIAYMARHLPERGGVFVQSESEVAAINMVYGAAATGVRSMTSSSSPGISLKQEGISYLAGAQLPCVIVNIMRGGPGLGNIAPGQSDYFQATKGGGHGDYHNIVLAPSCVQEAYDMMPLAFELADIYRNPVMVLGDGILGQMMEPLVMHRQKARPPVPKPWALTGCKGRPANVVKSFYLREGELETFNAALQKKYARIMKKEPRCQKIDVDDARILLVAYGTMARIAQGIVAALRAKGKKIGLLRPVTLWPFPSQTLAACVGKKTKVLVIEMSAGQMLEDVRLAVGAKAPVSFLGRMGGGIPQEEEILKKINSL